MVEQALGGVGRDRDRDLPLGALALRDPLVLGELAVLDLVGAAAGVGAGHREVAAVGRHEGHLLGGRLALQDGSEEEQGARQDLDEGAHVGLDHQVDLRGGGVVGEHQDRLGDRSGEGGGVDLGPILPVPPGAIVLSKSATVQPQVGRTWVISSGA